MAKRSRCRRQIRSDRPPTDRGTTVPSVIADLLRARRTSDLSHSHPAQRPHNPPLPFRRQRLPNQAGRPFAHRAIQASALRHTVLGIQVLAIRQHSSIYERGHLWDIEQMFRTVKSKGIDVENNLVAEGEAMENVAALSLIAAVRVMQ